jgi:hypothetical protein
MERSLTEWSSLRWPILNISLAEKLDTLAYFSEVPVMNKTSLITLTPGVNVIKLFAFDNYNEVK